jgi:AcrR family transcriptional regulator
MKRFREKKQALSEQAIRDAICQAVLDVLRTHGLEKLTMQRVAGQAHIATGTVYNYFKDKDALLVYAAERLFSNIRDLMRKVTEASSDPRLALAEMIRLVFVFFNENQFYFQFLDRADIYSKMQQSVKEDHVRQVRAMFAAVLQQGIEKGVFRKVDVETTADFFHRAVVGTVCLKPEIEIFDPEKEAGSLVSMFYAFLQC